MDFPTGSALLHMGTALRCAFTAHILAPTPKAAIRPGPRPALLPKPAS